MSSEIMMHADALMTLSSLHPSPLQTELVTPLRLFGLVMINIAFVHFYHMCVERLHCNTIPFPQTQDPQFLDYSRWLMLCLIKKMGGFFFALYFFFLVLLALITTW